MSENDIIGAIEEHDVDEIRQCFANGIDPNSLHNNEPLIYELLSEYTRGSRFKDCVKAFVDAGLKFDDTALLATLLNDAVMLEEEIKKDKTIISKRVSFRAAYTPLEEATLLHVCAEFNHVACAELLVKHGADVNATAGTDEYGFGAQTAIFHTVNQNNHRSVEMMQFLLEQGAKLDITVKGIIWGKGYPWETFIPSVNPISYAMMGLLPQMHRIERTINEVISVLLKHQYNINYTAGNIPNKYLNS
jgi:ankyrin repeat protein